MAAEDRLDGLEARVDARYAELKALRGAVHAMKKGAKDAEPEEQQQQEEQQADQGYAGAWSGLNRRRHIRGW